MNLFQKILFLSHVNLFQNLAVQDLELVASIVSEEEKEAEAFLFHEGDIGDRMYLIVSGEVDIIKDLPDGPKKLATRSTRHFFGEMALLDDERRSATAQCASNCHFLIIEKEDFVQLVMEYPAIALAILKYFCGIVRKGN